MINLEVLLEEYEEAVIWRKLTNNLPKTDDWRARAESHYKNAKAALINYINK